MKKKKEEIGKDKCMNPSCTNEAYTRGLCHNCYQSANNLVSQSRITWEALEKQGKAKPSSRNKIASWLLS